MIVGSEGNPEFTNLPRKFNMVVTGCLENCTPAESQDLALVPALRSDRAGFNVLVGGKMGSGGFTIASKLDVFVTQEDAALVAAELVRIFRDHGPRDARSKCRFAFLIEEWGVTRLRQELAERLGRELEPAGREVRSRISPAIIWGSCRRNCPSDGPWELRMPMGRMDPVQMDELARLAEEYGNSEMRLTMGQNVIIPNVPDERLDYLLDERPAAGDFSQAVSVSAQKWWRVRARISAIWRRSIPRVRRKAGERVGTEAGHNGRAAVVSLVGMPGGVRKSSGGGCGVSRAQGKS